MTDSADHTHVASNGPAELSLDDLAVLHGGLAHFMLEISERATRCFQACRARNRQVARHQLSELTKTLRLAVMVRPQYGEAIERFIDDDLAELREVIAEEHWEDFDRVWATLTVAVNRSHEEFNHGYLVWRVPENAPSDLDLDPRS